ncbi:MAG: efflux RND transporter periplasmic adaptor subunit [Pseudomonadota bacterium]
MMRLIALAVGSLTVLAGCTEPPPPPPEEVVRSIKSLVVSERAGAQVRRIAGVVEADLVSDLSFEAAGKLVTFAVELGDEVARGDVVGELDAEPFELSVKSAKGSLSEADARLRDARAKFNQQKELIAKGYTARSDYETSLANLNSARSAVSIARSQLEIAERDLKQARLLAPFNGRISEKYVQRYAEVSPGQAVVQLSSLGDQKVDVNLPEGLINFIAIGDAVDIRFPTLPGKPTTGRIATIGSRAGSTNSFPVSVTIDRPRADVKPGLSAEVSFQFTTASTGKAFMLPVTAVLPSDEQGRAFVYVFDAGSSTVARKAIEVVNVRDNELEVTGGITEGDIVASAGVSFLSDGMRVKLLESELRRRLNR